MFQFSGRSSYRPPLQKSFDNHPPLAERLSNRKIQLDSARLGDKAYQPRDFNDSYKNTYMSNTKGARQSYNPLADNYKSDFKCTDTVPIDKVFSENRFVSQTPSQNISSFRNGGTSKQDDLLRKLELYEQKYQVQRKNPGLQSNDFKFNIESRQNSTELYRKKEVPYGDFERQSKKSKLFDENLEYKFDAKPKAERYNPDIQRGIKNRATFDYQKEIDGPSSYQSIKNYKRQDDYHPREQPERRTPEISHTYERKYGKQKDEIRIEDSSDYESRRQVRNQNNDFKREDTNEPRNFRQPSKAAKEINDVEKFYAERSQRKESLKERSEQLKLKMNCPSPSPLKRDGGQLSSMKSEKYISECPSFKNEREKEPQAQTFKGEKTQKISEKSDKLPKYERLGSRNYKEVDVVERNHDRSINERNANDWVNERNTNDRNFNQRTNDRTTDTLQQRLDKNQRAYQKSQRTQGVEKQQRANRQFTYRPTAQHKERQTTQESSYQRIQAKPEQTKKTPFKTPTQEKQVNRKAEVEGKKLEFEQQTYKKIETINELNNKINERIKHILSNFNQDI